MTGFGTVRDYRTGRNVRPATAADWRRTAAKLYSGDSDDFTGAWAEDGRSVYADGGPDTQVTVYDVQALQDEAAAAGDTAQVALCEEALHRGSRAGLRVADVDAYRACAAVILDHRMNAQEGQS